MGKMRHVQEKCVLFLMGIFVVACSVCGRQEEVRAEEQETVSVETPEQFYEAAENGRDISLENDILLTEPVCFFGGAYLYGNGYELRFEPDGEEDSFLVFSDGTEEEPCVIEDVSLMAEDGALCGNGICVEEDCVLEMTDVAVSGFRQGILNDGYATMESGKIIENLGNGVCVSGGTFRQTGGTVEGNGTDGVRIEDGTYRQDGGMILENERYGVYQDGKYEMAGEAEVESEDGSNCIFLTAGHYIDLVGKLTTEGQVGCIGLASDDRRLSRKLVDADEDVSDSYVASLNGRFALGFDKVDMASGDEERRLPDAAVRAGNGINAPAGTMILSGTLTGDYESGVTQEQMERVPGFIVADMPEKESFYWKEPHIFSGLGDRPVPQKELLDENGEDRMYAIDGSMEFQGWTSRLNLNGEPLTEQVEVPAERLGDDVTFTAAWDFRFDLLCEGNGQTNGDEALGYEIYDLTAESEMPANDGPQHDARYLERDSGATAGYFQKSYQWTAAEQKRYDKNRESYVDYVERYAFVGWSKRADCRYGDEDFILPGAPLGGEMDEGNNVNMLEWFLSELAQVTEAHGRTAADGKVGIRYYAVWDCFPEINAPDRYFLLSDVKNGRVTEAELIQRAEAVDSEDDVLDNGAAVRLADFAPEDLLGLGDAGSVTVRYAATDSAGNTSYYDAAVHIANDAGSTSRIAGQDGNERRSPIYTRFVSQEFFALGADCGDEAAAESAYSDGALEPYSVWYRKKGYRSILEEAFSRLENGKFAERYSFEQDTIQSAQEFLRSKGMPMKGDDFREKFAEEFVRPAEK